MRAASRKKLCFENARWLVFLGAERVAYYGRDLSNTSRSNSHEEIVLKEYISIGRGDEASRFEAANQLQTVAAAFSMHFCAEIRKQLKQKKKITFLKTKTLALIDSNGAIIRYMSVERRYKKDDKFIRFTNNVNYALLQHKAAELGVGMQFVELLMAFSHWTYEVSRAT